MQLVAAATSFACSPRGLPSPQESVSKQRRRPDRDYAERRRLGCDWAGKNDEAASASGNSLRYNLTGESAPSSDRNRASRRQQDAGYVFASALTEAGGVLDVPN